MRESSSFDPPETEKPGRPEKSQDVLDLLYGELKEEEESD